MKIKIDYEKCCWKDGACQSCGCGKGSCCNGCVEVCPVQALERKDLLEIEYEKCINCGACISACEHEAINFDEE